MSDLIETVALLASTIILGRFIANVITGKFNTHIDAWLAKD